MDLDTLLNKNQKEAATYLDSHLRIIAGAGSGKTRVVTYRIAHLIQDIPDSDVIFPTPDGELAHRDSRNIFIKYG